MYFYNSQLESELEDIRCITSNLYAYTMMQDFFDKPLVSRIGRTRAINNAKADYDKCFGPDEPTTSSAAAGSVV